jgi:hypothetical protein
MKRKMILFTALMLTMLMSTMLTAQNLYNVDFEADGVGADWAWTVGENGDNPPLEIIDNPVSGGINTSATVAKFTARAAGEPWALCFTSDNGEFTFDAENSTVSILVNKPVISDVGIKFEGVNPDAEVIVANTTTDEWEELVFDFSGFIGNTYNKLIIIPDFADRTEDHIVYFDNIILPEGSFSPTPEPEVAAPTPTFPAENVISLFSNAYSDVTVDTWSADWDQADVADVQIEGNDTKKYTNLVYAGIEFTSETIDASEMTNFHMDIWTPDDTAAPAVFKIKLVDFGADGLWGGGDDVEDELTFEETTTPPLVTEEWINFDIPLSQFADLTTSGHLAQLIISGDPNTVFVDNVFFHSGGSQPEPEVAAPTPTLPAENVISLFSNAYADVTVDTWSADWDQAEVADVQVTGDDTKLYTGLNYAGVEFTSQTIDASQMTHFHIDAWTPDALTDSSRIYLKLVDFGADGAWSGGDDVEGELLYNTSSSPALVSEEWISFDIPLSEFASAGMATQAHLAQLIISSHEFTPNTLYVDNVYFYNSNTYVTEDVADISAAKLAQNYPNPFNPVTSISYELKTPARVSLKIYDVKGRLVKTLAEGNRSAASHVVTWEANNAASGIYFYQLQVNGKTVNTKRMLLLK